MLLHSTIIGTGKPLIIAHGFFGMGDNWKTLAKRFSTHFEVHLIDQRNHGRSFHSDDFNYELLIEDLLYYIKHYQLKEVSLIGHSMGGKMAMLFAVTYPEYLDKLVVVDIAPKYYEPHHTFIFNALKNIDFDKITTRREVAEVLEKYIDNEGIRQFLLKNVYWKTKTQLALRFNLESLIENSSEVGEALPPFTSFDKPTLFLKGDHSDYITEDDNPLIEAHFPQAKIITVKNSGHWLHADNPGAFYDNVSHFLLEN